VPFIRARIVFSCRQRKTHLFRIGEPLIRLTPTHPDVYIRYGTIESVTFADYGTPSGSCTSQTSGSFKVDPNCTCNGATLAAVQAACIGQSWCSKLFPPFLCSFSLVPVTLYTQQPMLNLCTFLGSVIAVLSPTVSLTHHSTNLLKYSRVLIPSILLSLSHHRHRYFSIRRKRKFVRENEIRPVPRSSQTHVCVGNVLQASTPCTATTDGLFR
jgi:hypothetical protein